MHKTNAIGCILCTYCIDIRKLFLSYNVQNLCHLLVVGFIPFQKFLVRLLEAYVRQSLVNISTITGKLNCFTFREKTRNILLRKRKNLVQISCDDLV